MSLCFCQLRQYWRKVWLWLVIFNIAVVPSHAFGQAADLLTVPLASDSACIAAINDGFKEKATNWLKRSDFIENNLGKGTAFDSVQLSITKIGLASTETSLKHPGDISCSADISWNFSQYGFVSKIEAKGVVFTIEVASQGVNWKDIFAPLSASIYLDGTSLAEIREKHAEWVEQMRQEEATQQATKKWNAAIDNFWSPLADCTRWNRMCRMYEQGQLAGGLEWFSLGRTVWKKWDALDLPINERLTLRIKVLDIANKLLENCELLGGQELSNCRGSIFQMNENKILNN